MTDQQMMLGLRLQRYVALAINTIQRPIFGASVALHVGWQSQMYVEPVD
jgi:hypothetical protein